VVQVSPAEAHGVLDAALAARGYRRAAPTLVLTAPPSVVAASAARAAGAGPAAVVIDEVDRTAWLAAYRALDGPADTSAVVERVLARVPAPAAFARVLVDGRPAAIGMFAAPASSAAPEPAALTSAAEGQAALEPAGGEWAGVFCMATAPDHRRRGLALAVLGAGARWAAARGCAGMYLQVEQENTAARHLYARAGFTHSHGYHYRIADQLDS
jgi:GNAT superfamily N-acetyltransferase